MDHRRKTRLRWRSKLALSLFLFAMLFELACQLYGRKVIARQQALRERPDHFFISSDNPRLGYELARNHVVETNGRVLRLNNLGLRDDEDGIPEGRDIMGVLGDSVVFGAGLSQDQTISVRLQERLDPEDKQLKVLNWGVPGYNLEELLEYLKVRQGQFQAAHIVYLLNPNDFCWRNTRYEGADNGLYRMYHPPWIKSPWFLRKLLYRFRKEGLISLGWYRWIYEGNRQRGLAILKEMAEWCNERGTPFTVALLPAGIAYGEDGSYALEDLYQDIVSFLEDHEISVINPVMEFSDRPNRYFTDSDHLTPEGSIRMAEFLTGHINVHSSLPKQ